MTTAAGYSAAPSPPVSIIIGMKRTMNGSNHAKAAARIVGSNCTIRILRPTICVHDSLTKLQMRRLPESASRPIVFLTYVSNARSAQAWVASQPITQLANIALSRIGGHATP